MTIPTIIATGEAGYTGDGGPAADAILRESFTWSFDTAGSLFFFERFATTSSAALTRSWES